MSLFQEDFANSQHAFAEVLDDETTTSGVLEISGLLPTSAKVPAAVAIDDNSSTDTIKLIEVSSQGNCQNAFFSTSKIYVINDDDSAAVSQIVGDGNDGVIVTTSGATIYLETPVVDEQPHHQQIVNIAGQVEFAEKPGKPKRLSDEFLRGEIERESVEEIAEEALVDTNNVPVMETSSNVVVFNFKAAEKPVAESKSKVIAEGGGNVVSETQHERMSVRLKKMNISNSTTQAPNSTKCNSQPSSSQTPTVAEIESMDLIERRDFETEQRLTGGIIAKTSSLINRNMLNLSLIKSCIKQQYPHEMHGLLDGRDHDDDCPGSSNNNARTVSSDSKCAYKDLSTTPTSSRNFNSRLTKSTAKLNLCHTLTRSEKPQQQSETKKDVDIDAAPLNCSSSIVSSTTIVANAPPSTSATLCSNNVDAADRPEMFSNFNSNDSLVDGPTSNATTTATTNCQRESKTATINQQATSGVTPDNGCGHNNNKLHPTAESEVLVFDDTQPSTSSARCQYAPPPKLRQVHASAQTNERYLTRGSGSLPITIVSANSSGVAVSKSNSSSNSNGINLSTVNRNRLRPDPTANLNRNSTSEEVIAAFQVAVAEAAIASAAAASAAAASAAEERGDFNDDPWADCDENNSDVEEICTCHRSSNNSSHGGSNTSLNETDDLDASVLCVKDADLSNYIQMVSISEETAANVSSFNAQQRKRKYNESRLIDSDNSSALSSSGGGNCCDANSRKRIAYDYLSTPRSSHNSALVLVSTPCVPQLTLTNAINSPIGKRTPRSIIPTRDNPPPELQNWLSQFQRWSHAERILAVDRLIEHCEPTQVRHMMKVIEPQFQRDFISLLPRELALQVLAYLAPKNLLRAAQTCRSWRFLCDDNLLWKEKCRKAQILTEPRTDRPKRGRAGNMPPIASPWKAAYMRQHIIEMNWRSRPIREPKVLKGHDDHVITCLQFSGNRIVSGSDDNTLKVWSAVTGRCLRTLVGHTGGVWSSQMAGNIIISGSTDRTLKVWDMETGQSVHTLQGHTSTVRCMHLHGNKVVSGSRDATLRVWDIDQGTCLHVLVGHLAAVRCVQYDGKLIVSGAYDYMVKIWHPERQECLHTLQGHTNRVYSLQFDGLHVVSGSLDTSIRVWDVETGNCKHTLMGHQSLTSGMELRQNILVSGNADSTVKVWDITTGQCLQTLSGPNKHQSAVTCLQFNSRFVVTSSDDGTVKLWDVKTGEFIRNLVALDSGGSGGVVWRIRANDTKLICAVGSRNGTEETKLMVLDFDVEGACVKCS